MSDDLAHLEQTWADCWHPEARYVPTDKPGLDGVERICTVCGKDLTHWRNHGA